MHLKDKLGQMSIAEAADLLSQDGKLIKRPLVVEGDRLTCGFKSDIYQKVWLEK
jgi:arsenate reductase